MAITRSSGGFAVMTAFAFLGFLLIAILSGVGSYYGSKIKNQVNNKNAGSVSHGDAMFIFISSIIICVISGIMALALFIQILVWVFAKPHKSGTDAGSIMDGLN